MVSVLIGSGFKPWLKGQTKLLNWYWLLLCKACSIKEKEQGLDSSESG
jgi:hypothetical protein